MILEHERPWRPLTVAAVAALFREAAFPWWVAGGHAIEMAVGHPVRSHGDIDVLLLRRDHLAARALLAIWDCWVADPPGSLRPWPVGETLPPSTHDVWCREAPGGLWRLQLMLDESRGDQWHSRWDARISLPITAIGARTEAGVPYLRPEIQLFNKARALRPRDEADLAAALPCLTVDQRHWLRWALVTVYGGDHPWLIQLGTDPAKSGSDDRDRRAVRSVRS